MGELSAFCQAGTEVQILPRVAQSFNRLIKEQTAIHNRSKKYKSACL